MMQHFKDLPKRLSDLVKKKGWTQKDLHERSGVAASQISEYLNRGAAICESCFADTFGEHCLLCGEAWLIEADSEFVPARLQ